VEEAGSFVSLRYVCIFFPTLSLSFPCLILCSRSRTPLCDLLVLISLCIKVPSIHPSLPLMAPIRFFLF